MVRLLLARRRPELTRLAAWLDEQEQALGMSQHVAYAVRLCLEEAVANLIEHAQAAGDIVVALGWQGDVMVATIEDQGPPFDPRMAPVPPRPGSLDDAMPGGLGIVLMRSFASQIDYIAIAGHNRLTLRFEPQAEPVPARP